jgi:SAM-dependent methyltransferase
VVRGIPRFFQDNAHYWGEVDRRQAQEFLEAARKGPWADAVRRYFPGRDMTISILDLQRAAWLPLLGLDPQAVALDIGSGYGAITHSLACSLREVYSVEAIPERIEFTQTRLQQEGLGNVHLVQASATALPFSEKSFDLLVSNGILEWIGEWDWEGDPRSAQLKFLSSAERLLKPDGVMVIGIENRFGYGNFLGARDHSGIPYTSLLPRPWATFWLRRSSFPHHRTTLNPKKEYRTYTYSMAGYRKLLAEAGFRAVAGYWADPGYNQPYTLIPLSARRLIQEYCLDGLGHPGVKRAAWRSWVKRASARLGLLSRVVPDFVIIASKNPRRKSRLHEWFREQFARQSAGETDRNLGAERIVLAGYAHPFLPKHTLRFREPVWAGRRLIVKAESRVPYPTDGVPAEFRNLALVTELLRGSPEVSVRVPRPVDSLRIGNTVYYLQSMARGVEFPRLLRRKGYFDDLQRAREDFERVIQAGVELDIALQRLSAVNSIDPAWYEIPLQLNRAPEIRSRLERARYFSPSAIRARPSRIQHGDFAAQNIFFERQTGRTEVIDWNDLAGGLPPLYDLFTLTSTAGYLDPAHRGARWPSEEEYWKASFWDLVFDGRGFSQVAGALLVDACHRLEVSPDLIPALLVEFLVIRTNYYHARGSRAEERNHEAMLRLFLENADRPVFGRFKAAAG